MKLFHTQNIVQFINSSQIKTRPNASPGLWLMFLLPLSLIISAATQPITSTATYKLSSLLSVGLICASLVFLHQSSKKKRLKFYNIWLITAAILTTILFRICLHRGILFSAWSAAVSTILYLQLYSLVLEKFPLSFTLGEAALCTQSYTVLLYFTPVNVFEHFFKTTASIMQTATLIIQVVLFGIALIALLVHKLGITSPQKFYALSIFVVIFIVLLPLEILLGTNPLIWITNLLWEDLQANKLVLYWSICSFVAVLVVRGNIKEAKKASSAMRKVFHILTVAVYIPGLLYNCSLLYLASGITFGLFFVLEIVRALNVPPLAQYLQNGLAVFSDEKDLGVIAFTPMYLLAGCSLPLWIHPAPCDVTNSAIFSLLPLLSGLLTTGIGDMAASVIGSKYGSHYWHGSKKTLEGTLACIVSQLLVIFAFLHLDLLKLVTTVKYAKVIGAVIITSLIEAKTDQVDNLVLPFAMYIILIV